MARLRSFSQRTFGARLFIPIWGKPAEQAQGGGAGITRVDRPSLFRQPIDSDDEEVLMMVCQALMVMVNGRR